jgi:type II secretory ATPase GspE/PulE/Tfp pilus assembly ATPase PilB-like protein
MRPLVLERASAAELRAKARAEGMRSLREDGIIKAIAGLTTVEEVLAETQGDDA